LKAERKKTKKTCLIEIDPLDTKFEKKWLDTEKAKGKWFNHTEEDKKRQLNLHHNVGPGAGMLDQIELNPLETSLSALKMTLSVAKIELLERLSASYLIP